MMCRCRHLAHAGLLSTVILSLTSFTCTAVVIDDCFVTRQLRLNNGLINNYKDSLSGGTHSCTTGMSTKGKLFHDGQLQSLTRDLTHLRVHTIIDAG